MGWRRLLEGDGKESVVSMMGVVLRKCWGGFFFLSREWYTRASGGG